jgi:hypothetical protein
MPFTEKTIFFHGSIYSGIVAAFKSGNKILMKYPWTEAHAYLKL